MVTIAPAALRTTVQRNVRCSTRPISESTWIRSPTTYWSSKTMKKPLMKSFSRLCAPKAIATLARPGGGERGGDVEIEHLETHQDRDDCDDGGADAVEQTGHGAGLLLAHLSGARLSFGNLYQAGGESSEQAREEQGKDKDDAEAEPGLSYNFQPP